MRRYLLLAILALVPSLAAAQTLDSKVQTAQDVWRTDLGDKPLLVSMGQLADLSEAGAQVQTILRERLKLLSKKTFSNRQWRTYWEKQRDGAQTLLRLFAERASAGGPTAGGDAAKEAGLKTWAALAEAKTVNQDEYLHAIETERDAVDERLEGSLEHDVTEVEVGKRLLVDTGAEGLTPFQRRHAHLQEVRQRLEFQASRRALAELEHKLVTRQSESQLLLRVALEKDGELARQEHRIAAEQAQSTDPSWAAVWRPIAAASAVKAEKIEAEVQLGAQRVRTLAVQISLAQSQLDYRSQKLKELQQDLDKASAVTGWIRATWETTTERAPGVLAVLLLLFLGLRGTLLLIKAISRGIVKSVEDEDPDTISAAEQRAGTIAAVFKGFAKIAAYAVAVLLAMNEVGINTGPILGSVAILGLAVSFGSQNLVRDVVNGFFILIENQYAVGDWVDIGGRSGEVEAINIRSTRLRALGGSLHIIPNGEVTSVENMTRDWARVVCHIGVAYGCDIDAVEKVVNEVGAELYADPAFRGRLHEQPKFIGVTALDDSAVVVRTLAKCKAGTQWGLERELNRRFKHAFDEQGIEIPFPQRVVWQRGEDATT